MTEREKLIKLLMKCSNVPSMFAEKLADYFLSHGVTIPVRCAECKMAHDADNSTVSGRVVICGLYASRPIMMISDDFCSYGERRDNETD